jgi:mercuric ion transport protein
MAGASMTINTKGSLIAGVLAALGASACCAGPLILLMLGISGSWASHLLALEPYSPYLTGLTLLFIAAAFHNLYLRPRACAPGDGCAAEPLKRNQQLVFWLIAVPVLLLLAFPWFAPLFY